MKINFVYNKTDAEKAIALSLKAAFHTSFINRLLTYHAFVCPVAATGIGILLLLSIVPLVIMPLVRFLPLSGTWVAFVIGGLLGGLSLSLVHFALFVRKRMIESYLAHCFMTEPGTFEFGPQGVAYESNATQSVSDWGIFERAVYNDEMLLLYVDMDSFFIMPRRMFTDLQWQELMKLVQEHIEVVQEIA